VGAGRASAVISGPNSLNGTDTYWNQNGAVAFTRSTYDLYAGKRPVGAANSTKSNLRPIVVAIPVHNEAEYIEPCLTALAQQQCPAAFQVVTLLNNCTDDTAGIVRGLASRLPYELHIHEHWLDPASSNAGVARRMATQCAQMLAGEDGIILTTDADSRVADNWIAANLAAIDAGSDAVAGMAMLNDDDAATLPPRLIEDDEKCEDFGTLLDEIDWLLDPDAADPWPRHTQHSGASIAVRASCLTRAGGIPAIPLGEDRQLFARLRQVDARIRHARDVLVRVSGRTIGRAKGGMADTIARRLREPDRMLDECMEPAMDRARRAMLRAATRELWAGNADAVPAAGIARASRVSIATLNRVLGSETFGRAWNDLERTSPVLRRRTVLVKHLARETAIARTIIENIRANGPKPSIHRADIAHSAAARRHAAAGVSAE
jgi:GT2 family glycosyltransferase